MRNKVYTLSGGGAASATTYAALQAPVAGTPMTLTGAAASISPPRELTFTDTTDLSAIVFTIVGKDRWGNIVTDTINGPNNTTVRTKTIWSSVTSITPSASNAGTISVGNAQRVVSPWVQNPVTGATAGVPQGTVQMEITSGAPTASIEVTDEDVAFIPADGAKAATTPTVITEAAIVTSTGAYARAVVDSAAGSAKFTFTRVRF